MNHQDSLGDSTQDSASGGLGSGPAPRAGQGDDGSRISTQALIWGVVGIPFAWLLAPPIVAIVLGGKGRRRSRLATGRINGKATAGLVLGVVMICMLVFWLGVVALVSMMLSDGLERRAESMTITQLKDCGNSLDHFRLMNGRYPLELTGFENAERYTIDLLNRPMLYYSDGKRCMVGSRGWSLEDPGDDIFWDSMTKMVTKGPLPPELSKSIMERPATSK